MLVPFVETDRDSHEGRIAFATDTTIVDVDSFTQPFTFRSFTNIALSGVELLVDGRLNHTFDFADRRTDRAVLHREGRIAIGKAYWNPSLPAERELRNFTMFAPAAGSPGQGRWISSAGYVARVLRANGRTEICVFTPYAFTEDTAAAVTGGQTGYPDGGKWSRFGLPAVASDDRQIWVAVRGFIENQAGVSDRSDQSIAYGVGAAFDSANPPKVSGILREGDAAVGTEARWASFTDPVVNNHGDLAFFAELRGASVTDQTRKGLWSGNPNGLPTLGLVAREGDQTVPDADGILVPGRRWGRLISYALPNADDPSADVLTGPVFIATVAGADVRRGSHRALYGVGSDGKTIELLRTGDEVGGSGKRLAGFTLLEATRGCHGSARSYSGARTLALRALFTDHTQGLVRIDIP